MIWSWASTNSELNKLYHSQDLCGVCTQTSGAAQQFTSLVWELLRNIGYNKGNIKEKKHIIYLGARIFSEIKKIILITMLLHISLV